MSDEAQQTPGIEDATITVLTTRQLRRVREILARLSGARRAHSFYPVGHPVVLDSVGALMETLGEMHAEGVDVAFTFFDNEVLLGQQLLPEESVMFDQLVRDMSAGATNSVTFKRGLTRDELERALPILFADVTSVRAQGGLEALVKAAGVPHVEMAAAQVMERDERVTDMGDRDAAKAAYSDAIDLMRDMDHLLVSNRVAASGRVRRVARGLVDNVLQNRYALLELSGLKDYDEYTFFHSVNVAILSLALGATLSRERRFLDSLGVGALMHDIGKLTVEAAVLNKPGALTSKEWDTVRLHPLHGAEVAATMPGLDRSSIVIIFEHHMRYDLEGYPVRRPRRRQNILSRVVAIADAYDAMTSRRSYSIARLQDEAMEILVKSAGTAFDPVMVQLFAHTLGVYPPRSIVRLNTGEMGVVVSPAREHVLRPSVRVFADPRGTILEPREIDLAEPGAETISIVSCIDPAGLNIDVEQFL